MEFSLLPCESASGRPWLYSLRPVRAGGYELHLTDATKLFRERLTPREAVDRCQDLNPAVEFAQPEDLVEELTALLADKTSNLSVEEEEEAGVRLKANGKLFGYDFRWNFAPSRLDSEKFFDFFLSDVLKCFSHLLEQNRHLLEVIRNKDLELLDYRQGGATLTRKNLKTERLDKAAILKQVSYVPKDDPQLISVLASGDFREVQRAVEAGRNRKVVEAATTPEEERSRARDRKRRIKIKGAAAQLFKEEDDDHEEQREVDSPKKTGEKRQVQLSESIKNKKQLAKKLRKL